MKQSKLDKMLSVGCYIIFITPPYIFNIKALFEYSKVNDIYGFLTSCLIIIIYTIILIAYALIQKLNKILDKIVT